MNTTVNASSAPLAPLPAIDCPRLPRLNHGVRWTITRPAGPTTPPAFQVRAYRSGTLLRVVDQSTRRDVLRVNHQAGSDHLPSSDVLFDLLRWCDPNVAPHLPANLRGLTWLVTQTSATEFTLSVRVVGPDSAPGPRTSARPLPLPARGRTKAARQALLVLRLAPDAAAPDHSSTPLSASELTALVGALRA